MRTMLILKRLNNGWIWLVVLLVVYTILFITGKNTVILAPNPVCEGRRLSDLTDDLLDVDPIPWGSHDEAVEVLRRHQEQIRPALIQWLDARNTVPQIVYFSTMKVLERFARMPPDDSEVYSNQYRAAKAFRALGERDPIVIAALERNLEHYKAREIGTKGRDRLTLTAENALHKTND